MKQFSIFLTVFCLISFICSPDTADMSARNTKTRSHWRQKLLELFCQLDLEKIVSGDREYLNLIGADFDADNQRFFIEPLFSKSTMDIDECFVFIEHKRPGEAVITVYPPHSEPSIWLRARLRTNIENLSGTVIFEPGLFYDDSFNLKIPISRETFKTAGVIVDY